MKGSKYKSYIKDGMKVSRKWYKDIWNRRIRHSKEISKNCEYKKITGGEIWNGIV